jgi:hypothetical protein
MAAHLDMLLTPSIDGVGEVYQQLKSILGTAAAQQTESSLQHWKASILTPVRPKDGGQRAAQGAIEVGMTYSLARILAYDRLSRPGTRSDPQVQCWPHLGDDDV